MTAEDALSALTAGLDRDEQLARACEHDDGPGTLEWRVGGARNIQYDNGCSEEAGAVFCGDWDRIRVLRDVVRGLPLSQHIANFDPARSLRELPLKRLILERHKPVMQRKRWSPEEGWTGPMVCPECSPDDTDPDIWLPEPWPCDYIKALQAIYEPTEESA